MNLSEIKIGVCNPAAARLQHYQSVCVDPTPAPARPQGRELRTRQEAAAYLGVKAQTLAAWACTQRYPLPFVKIGRRVMYRIADLDAFVLANLHTVAATGDRHAA